MISKSPFWLLLSLFIASLAPIQAQDKFDLGELQIDDLGADYCPIDSSAGAYYLEEYGQTRIASNMKVYFRKVVRLKILSEKELDQANVTVPYLNESSVRRIEGFTYNIEGGELSISELSRDNVFREKVDDDYSNLKLSFPNAKVGSVIEYSYEIEKGGYNSLNTWYFQRTLPVMHSEYHIKIPDYFDYQRMLSGYIGLNDASIEKEVGQWGNLNTTTDHHRYLALEVPAFYEEAYSPVYDNIIAKINFELRSVNIPGVLHKTYLPKSYGALAYGIAKSDDFDDDLKDARYAREKLIALMDSTATELDSAKKIFEYLKTFKKEKSSSLKKAFKDESASDFDLNRLLVAMLRENGHEAYPVLISTRAHGVVNPYLPMKKHFNFLIVKLNIGDETYLLDASEKDNVFGVLPQYCLNGKGLVIYQGPELWVDLEPYSKNGTMVQAKMKLELDGSLNGDLSFTYTGYEARNFNGEKNKSSTPQDLYNSKENWDLNSYEFSDKGPLQCEEKLNLSINAAAEELGEMIYFKPILSREEFENPFKSITRIYPVQFVAPFTNRYVGIIEVPDSLEIVSVPESARISLPNNSGSMQYSINAAGNLLIVNQIFQISNTQFLAEDYDALREFYTLVVGKIAEPIVLKRK